MPGIRKQPGFDAGRGVDDIEVELSVPNIVLALIVVVAAVAGACAVNVIGTQKHVNCALIQRF